MKGVLVSQRQVMILVFCGLLSPLIRIAPKTTAALAGAGGWLAPLLALPVFLGVLWLIRRGIRCLPDGSGLGELFQRAFGTGLGRLASWVTAFWLVFLTGVALRFCAEDFVSAVYLDTEIWLFLLGLMGVVWWMGRKGFGAVCRMSQIFLWFLAVIVAVVLVGAAPENSMDRVWPVWLEGWDRLFLSSLPVLAALGHSIPILFRSGIPGEKAGGMALIVRWYLALCLVLALLNGIIIGVFGWQTVARMQMPFFSLAKEETAFNIVERQEAIVAGVWVFSDLALFCGQLLSALSLLQRGEKGCGVGWLGAMCAGAVAVAVLLPTEAFALHRLWAETVERWDWILWYGLPVLASLVILMKERRRG